MLFFFCPLSSFLTERYGGRRVTMAGGLLMSIGLLTSSFAKQLMNLYFTYGVVFGFGTALAYLPTLVMVGKYFKKRRSLATGIATCGSNFGALSLSILQEVILKKYNWRNVFRFNAGFSLLVIISGVLFKPMIPVVSSTTRREGVVGLKNKLGLLMRNRLFVLWCVASTVATFGYFIPHVHLVRYAQDNNASLQSATLLLTYMSLGSALGKLIYGRISDCFQNRTKIIYVTSMFVSGLASVLFSFVSGSYAGLVCYVLVFGLLDGSFIGLMSIITFKYTASAELMSYGWGVSLMFMSCSMIVGPPSVGWLRDINISYKSLFYMSGGPMMLGAVILAPTIWMENKVDCHENSQSSINEPVISKNEQCNPKFLLEKSSTP
ncbi:monocarboxylate transporter 10-like isoform X2 [Xenia sp. Carnegie-2017]|nr:monocarboxylate transporter 10-like isoform X2 [Xenia sp. Carnegie-2017]